MEMRPQTGFHFKFAAARVELAVVNIETNFASQEGQDKVGHMEITFRAADIRPLLILGDNEQ